MWDKVLSRLRNKVVFAFIAKMKTTFKDSPPPQKKGFHWLQSFMESFTFCILPACALSDAEHFEISTRIFKILLHNNQCSVGLKKSMVSLRDIYHLRTISWPVVVNYYAICAYTRSMSSFFENSEIKRGTPDRWTIGVIFCEKLSIYYLFFSTLHSHKSRLSPPPRLPFFEKSRGYRKIW